MEKRYGVKKPFDFIMSILTFTMSNITINEEYLQSPFKSVHITISAKGSVKCSIKHAWVEKGMGQIVVLFKNDMDFRTLIQLDMRNLLEEIFKPMQELECINDVDIYDSVNHWTHCDQSIFLEGWNVCHNGVLINDRLFRLNELHLIFKINDVDE